MVEKPDLETLLNENPRAREQAKLVGDALELLRVLLRALRAQGMVRPRHYDLERPFGQRARIRGLAGSIRKLADSA